MRLKAASLLITALCVTAGHAKAQFIQYTQPGGPEERPEDRQERVEREMASASRRLGPVRIDPLASLRNVAYVRNLFGSEGTTTSDVTATLGVGLNAYLRTGPKVVWVAKVLPEYVWWQERVEERRLNQRYGLTAYGFFNHLTLEATASREELLQILTPEVPQPANGRQDRVGLTAELKPTGHVSTYVTATESWQESLAGDSTDPRLRALDLLDRRERVGRAGVRWRPREGYMVGAGIERSEVNFENPLFDASNTGTAPVVEALIDRRRLFVQLDVAARSLEARSPDSRFVAFDGVTGTLTVSVQPREHLEFMAYTNRNLVYSLSPAYPYLDDRRRGLAVEVGFKESLAVRFFGELGSNEYVASSPDVPERTDDLSSFGGALRFDLPGSVQVMFRVVRSEFKADAPAADRSYTSGGISVTLGGIF